MTTTTGHPDSLTVRVAEEIRSVMGRRRLTGARLAKKLGVSQMWVSYRLTGRQPIDINDLDSIAQALDVEIIDLIPRDRRNATYTYLGEHRPTPGRPPSYSGPSGPGRTARTRGPQAPVNPTGAFGLAFQPNGRE